MSDKPEPAPLAEPWASMPDAESTSAALRRVQGERDELAARLARILGAPRVTPPTVALGMVVGDELCLAVNQTRDAYIAAEAELVEARQQLAAAVMVATQSGVALDAARAELDRAWDMANRNCAAAAKAVAELASARTELDAVRRARDNLDRDLASSSRALIVARRELRDNAYANKLCPRCGVEVDAEVEGETQTTEGEPPA